MSNRVRLYKMTEWALVRRWLAIAALIIVGVFLLWLAINLEYQFCPGKTDCETAPKHSLRNLL